MKLVHANDFEAVKNIYIDVIENTPLIERYARWVYGKHPTDEQIKAYIERDEMYFLMDEDDAAGVVAISMNQGAEYEKIVWRDKLPNDRVATVHLLAVSPSYQGRSLGIKLLEEAMKIAVRNGKKALRLDALKTNLPAQRIYCRRPCSAASRAAFSGHAGPRFPASILRTTSRAKPCRQSGCFYEF